MASDDAYEILVDGQPTGVIELPIERIVRNLSLPKSWPLLMKAHFKWTFLMVAPPVPHLFPPD